MRFLKELLGNLAEIVNEADGGVLLERVGDAVDVDVALVKEMMKDVDCLEGRMTLLFEAENEVDPLVQMSGNEVAFQSFAMSPNEFSRIALGPRREEDIV